MFLTHTAGLALAALALLGLGASRPAQAQTYDAAGDFSIASNPNGVWSYGYENSLGGTLNLYTDLAPAGASSNGWIHDIALGTPVVRKNFGASADTFADVVLQPGQLMFHPGPNDQYSIVRFTADHSGVYQLDSSFAPLTTDGTTTDVHVLENGVSLFDGSVTGTYNAPTGAPSFSDSLMLNSGDTVDFAVGYGANGNFYQDSTALAATLKTAPVPEASTTVSLSLLLALGLGGLAISARRRKAPSAE